MALRTPVEQFDRAHNQLKELIIANPIVNANMVGIRQDGDRVILTMCLEVPRSNTNVQAVETLKFVHKVNEALFDYGTFFCPEPNDIERKAMEAYDHTKMLSRIEKYENQMKGARTNEIAYA